VSTKYQAYCQPTNPPPSTTPPRTTTNNPTIINNVAMTTYNAMTTTTTINNVTTTTTTINYATTVNNATTTMNEGNDLAKQKRQRAQETLVLDNLKSNSDKCNIIILYDAFLDFLKSFVCVACLTNQDITLMKLIRGSATSITSKCKRGQKVAIKAKICLTAKISEKYEANTIPGLWPSANYDLNVCFMLTLYSQGKGERDAAAFTCMMNLALCPLLNCWEKMEEELCVSIIVMTTQIIAENLEEETKLTEEMQVLGVEGSPTTTKSHADLDAGQIRKSVWDKTTDQKRIRVEANTEKCLEGRQLTKHDNIKNFAYRRGMARPQANDPEEENSDPTKNKLIAQSICAYCDKKGHKMTKSKLCLFTLVLISPFYRPDNVERSTGKPAVHFVPWFLSKNQRMNA
jgi:hypothetical protein